MNMSVSSMIETAIFGNTVLTWLFSVTIFSVSFLILIRIRKILFNRLQALSVRTGISAIEHWARLIDQTNMLSLAAVSIYLSTLLLELTPATERRLSVTLVVVLIVQAGIWISRITTLAIHTSTRLYTGADSSSASAVGLLTFLGKFLVWIVVALLVLDNLGVNITTLVTGLGIGGIAIALAVQNLLSDLLASLSIVLDKPFEVGDFIIVGDGLGSVERIGIKTTRVRSLTGEQLIFSNSDLLSSRIRNYKRMFERRIVFSIDVTYQTPPETVRRISVLLEDIVKSQDGVRFDRAHFQSFGESALKFEVVYFVRSADYNQYMDIQQSINYAILERFTVEKIEFAYPTRTLYTQAVPRENV